MLILCKNVTGILTGFALLQNVSEFGLVLLQNMNRFGFVLLQNQNDSFSLCHLKEILKIILIAGN